ncbi:phosphotransferase family protein [Microvirga sp. TS319]|uniref:phosphotransferase family protein n=1 Tax=Microvirga sp. TS319 TaxID=3241165 RepID=UPI00351A9ABF
MMPQPPTVSERQARAMARAIIIHHFGSKPRRVSQKGGGLTNFVYEANHAEGDFIVRMSPQPSKVKEYLKEQWAMARAHEVGVPVPEVLEVGADVVPVPYMVSRKVAGREATHHPERMAVLREMGRLTALIHTIPTSGFGHTFDWSSNQLSRKETWAEYLKRELHIEQRLKVLEANRMLSKPQLTALRATLHEIESLEEDTVLNHGDMRLKNVMVNDTGNITAVIDWEFCSSNVAPHWDLALALHDLSVDAKQAFLGGYGVSEKEVRAMAPILKALNVINYAPFVERAAEEQDEPRLEQYRTRFSGALDLYSL